MTKIYKYDEETKQAAIDLYCQGSSVLEIAEMLEISKAAISRWTIDIETYHENRYIEISDTDSAWTAGILDGEANFNIHVSHGNYQASIRVSTTTPIMTTKLHLLWDGSLNGPMIKGHMTPVYQWTISRRSDLKFMLEKILPYLTIKSDHAKIILEYIERFPGREITRQNLTDEDRLEAAQFRDNIQSINSLKGGAKLRRQQSA